MAKIEQELIALGREAEEYRQQQDGKHFRWPDEICRKAVRFVSTGVSKLRIAQTLGVSDGAVRLWQQRYSLSGNTFREVKVIANAAQTGEDKESSDAGIAIRSRNGNEVWGLRFNELCQLMRQDLI